MRWADIFRVCVGAVYGHTDVIDIGGEQAADEVTVVPDPLGRREISSGDGDPGIGGDGGLKARAIDHVRGADNGRRLQSAEQTVVTIVGAGNAGGKINGVGIAAAAAIAGLQRPKIGDDDGGAVNIVDTTIESYIEDLPAPIGARAPIPPNLLNPSQNPIFLLAGP